MEGTIAFTKDINGWRCAGHWSYKCQRTSIGLVEEKGKKTLLLQGRLNMVPGAGQYCAQPHKIVKPIAH